MILATAMVATMLVGCGAKEEAAAPAEAPAAQEEAAPAEEAPAAEEGGLVALLLKLHLPQSLGHIPAIHTVRVGEERILLSILLGIPQYHVLMLVTIYILYRFLVVA